MLTEPFKRALAVIETIERAGHRAYFVGGCVRDLILKRAISDIDIASSAPPEYIAQLFDNVIPVGVDHGTVIVRHESISYEITTFKSVTEGIAFGRTIEDDVQCRDFTMNALAMDKHGTLIDLHDGKTDIENKVIRTAGSATARFREDPLRMIRALRFASQLGFTIEQTTLKTMKKLNHSIETVAVERLMKEFMLFFEGAYLKKGMSYVRDTAIFHHLPLIKDYPHIIEKCPALTVPFDTFAAIIALLHQIEPRVTVHDWISAWKCSNGVKKTALNLTHALTYFKNNGLDTWLVYQLDPLSIRSFVQLTQILNLDSSLQPGSLLKMKNTLPIQSKSDLEVNGHDLMELFPTHKKGQWIGTMMSQIERKVVFGQLENKNNVIKEWIKCHPPAIN